MTVAMLMKNTVISAQKVADRMLNIKWNLRPLRLKKQKPVPRFLPVYLVYSQT
jgi:methylenetetrahydrofolate dehydrogenase (NADP+)/methenyltetrahydrofolate cyclohydrolase/formyltetrahydrofolate synthetase